jgi:hypothetical protein
VEKRRQLFGSLKIRLRLVSYFVAKWKFLVHNLRPARDILRGFELARHGKTGNYGLIMMGTATVSQAPKAEIPSRGEKASWLAKDMVLYILLTALVLAAWQFSRMRYFRAGDNVGYWIGVAGGVMALLLFTYPLRKYMRFMHRWGKVKWWFVVHMVLGIGGPLLILLHSTFRIGSLNAGVALWSMVIVASSGVVGRFIYIRVHRGLHGERSSLAELQSAARFDQTETRSKLHFAPAAEARLMAFEERELKAKLGWMTYFRQVFVLPALQWFVYRACMAEIREPLIAIVKRRGLDENEFMRLERQAGKLVKDYLRGVVRVAQYTAYERIFALWHVVHVPFVYLFVICAVVHVFAVHAY